MKKIVSLLLSLMMICMMTAALAEDAATGVQTTPGGTLSFDVSVTEGGSIAKIGIKTNGAPVTFTSAVGGSVNDTVPPKALDDYFVVTNMDGVSISPDGTTLSGSLDSFTVAALEAGVVGTLTFTVNEDAAYGTYTVEAYKVQGDCTVSGAVTFTVSDRLPGDANADGIVNALDAMTIAKYAAGWENVSINLSNADVTADGTVNALDAMNIAKYAAGWENVELK